MSTEQTHAKNLDNLRTAISIGQSIGGSYLPSSPLIDISKMQTFEDEVTAVMQAVNDHTGEIFHQPFPTRQLGCGKWEGRIGLSVDQPKLHPFGLPQFG